MSFSTKRFYLLLVSITFIKIIISSYAEFSICLFEDGMIARNINASGEFFYFSDGVKNYSYQFPVYPFIVFCLSEIGGVIIIFNILVYSCAAALFREVFKGWLQDYGVDSKMTDVAVFIFLLHPFLNYYAVKNVHPLLFNIFTFSFALFALQFYCRKNSLITGILFGFSLSLLWLDRSVLFLVVFVLFILFASKRFGYAEMFKKLLLLLGFSFVLVSPWMYRNYIKTGSFQMVSTTGKILWKGSEPGMQGGNYSLSGSNYYSLLTEQEIAALGKMTVVEQDQYFKNRFVQNVKEHPFSVFKLYLIKLKNFWFFRSDVGSEYPQSLTKFFMIYKIAQLLMLVLVGYLLLKEKKLRVLFLIPVLLSLIQAIFYVETRHRMPVEVILIFFAVIAIERLYMQYSRLPGN